LFSGVLRLSHYAPLRSIKRPFTMERLPMKRVISIALGIFITLCMIVGSERRAWGYVDPGSGLIALQGIASVAAAYAYYVRRRIRAFFARKKEPAIVVPVTTKAGESREVA
jgi:hypothetical protein